jgi:uncharacterized protein (DUF58 family)
MGKLVAPAARRGPGPMPDSAVRALDIAVARRVAGFMPGEHRSVGVGAGTELAQLRPYAIGDDVRQLDAAASARTGEPWVRQQVPERTLTSWIVCDVSASMAFGTAERLKSDVAEGVARVVARIALRRSGRVGLLTFGAEDEKLLAPRGGRTAQAAVRRALEEGVAADGAGRPDALAAALRRTSRLARRPGFVVVISDFRETSDWEHALRALCGRHEVLCVEIADPREVSLPDAGLVVMTDPETGRQMEVDLSSRRLREAFERAEAERALRVAGGIRRAGARHALLSTNGDWLRGLGGALARRRAVIRT